MARFLSCMVFHLLLCVGLTPSLSAFAPLPQEAWSPSNEVVYQGTDTYQDHMENQSGIWTTNYQAALAQAQRENKAVLLFFTGSDWCTWCTRLEQEVLDQPKFVQALSPHFVFVKLDYPRSSASISPQEAQQNAALKRQYNITQYPTVVIVTAQEQVLDRTGYIQGGPDQFNPTVLRNVQRK